MSDESSSSAKKIRKRLAKRARKEKKLEESEALDAKGVIAIPKIGPTPFTPRQLNDRKMRNDWFNPSLMPIGMPFYFFKE